MRVVLDTSILCQDPRLVSTAFRVFLDGLPLVPVQLQIPEVVLDETMNRYREDLVASSASLKGALDSLGRLLPSNKFNVALPDLDTALLQQRQFLDASFSRVKAKVLPYPKVSHQKVVERDLARRRPFTREGKGYRDTLIWETVCELASSGGGPIVFVTANTKDFGEGPAPHPELLPDLAEPSSVRIVTTLKAFNTEYILPRLKDAEELRSRLENTSPDAFDIHRWMEANAEQLLHEDDVRFLLMQFPDSVGSFHVASMTKIGPVKVEGVKTMESGDRLVTISADVVANISITVDGDDYENYVEVRDAVGHDEPLDSGGWCSWNEEGEFAFEVDLILDAAGSRLKDFNISRVSCGSRAIEY